jgi:hypothetical protein
VGRLLLAAHAAEQDSGVRFCVQTSQDRRGRRQVVWASMPIRQGERFGFGGVMRAATFEQQARETSCDFGFDPLLMNFLNFTAELGDFIEAGEFKAFKRVF